MTLLPIVDRELRVTARRRSTFWIRVIFAGAGAMVAAWALWMSFLLRGAMGNVGQIIFGGLSSLAFVYCLLGGIFRTADTLSGEKREGTLGLMFLTDLRSYDVVLGKLTAGSVNWFYGLLAVFPILALGMMLGGVGLGEFWRRLLALVNLAFVSLAAGMLVSSISRHAGKAMVGTAAMLALLLVGLPALADLHQKLTGGPEPTLALLLPNPAYANTLAGDYFYQRQPERYWQSLGVSALVGWLMLGSTCGLLGRTWRERGATARQQRWLDRWRNWRLGKPGRRAARRRAWMEVNPFAWLTTRERWRPLLAALVVPGIWGAGLASAGGGDLWAESAFMLYLGQVALKVWMAFEASRRFIEDRRSGTLELVLCTPLDGPDIVRGHWTALRRQCAVPVLLAVVAATVCLLGALYEMRRSPLSARATAVMVFGAAEAVFVADMATLGWLGMWFGMTSRHVYWAVGRALLIVVVLPWVGFYAGMTMVMTMALAAASIRASTAAGGAPSVGFASWMVGPVFFICLWAVVGLLIDVLFAVWARRRLLRDFRVQAARQFDLERGRAMKAAAPAAVAAPPIIPQPPPMEGRAS